MLRATLRVQHGIRIAPNIPQLMATGFNPIINVKDYGAVGDGSHDDTTAIQTAFDTAFGTAGSPHGNGNKFLNLPVFFPAGHYKTTLPLYLTTIIGGWIFGAGSAYTVIEFLGSFSGNTVVANGITPVLMMNGVSYTRIEGIGFKAADNNSVCIYNFTSASNTSTGNDFYDISTFGATDGIIVGYQALNGTCSECTYIDCNFNTHSLYGLRIILANALNHSMYGGSISNCGTGVSCNTGGVGGLVNVAFALNTTDVENNSAAQAMAIVGGRSEQSTTGILAIACQVSVSGFTFANTTTMVNAATGGSVVLDGCNYSGASGVIAALGSSGLVVMDNMVSNAGTSTITGTAGSKLYLRGCQFGNASTITAYTGTVAQNI